MSGGRYVLYDFLQVAGGAERVALMVAAELDMTLVTSRVYEPARFLVDEYAQSPVALGNGRTQWLKRVPEAIHCHRHRTGFLKVARSVIYSGMYAPLAVRHQRGGRKIYYCHTAPRFAYDLRDEYRRRLPAAARPLFDAMVPLLRREYEKALRCMDVIAVNSKTVQRRLKEQLGMGSQVVYPPVDTRGFSWLADDGYFISPARLARRKRVDLIVRAFLEMPGKRLVVTSGGSELERLQALAGNAPNIHFTGWQGEEQLKQWIGRARAAIYIAEDEDFGMSPVEAMAAGKPVIGVAEGGLRETIIDGETGILLPGPPTPGQVAEAVHRLDGVSAAAMRAACVSRAERFDQAYFMATMRQLTDA